MKTSSLRRLCVAIIAGMWSLSASANVVPPFTPNVVDQTQTLTGDDILEVNKVIAEAKELADIWGAVLIVPKLEDDTIESLAEKAFREWQLGDKDRDNGLLLLLSMEDRQSRFEVGYGLEGDLPDLVAKRALDNVLAPLMREGNLKEAIVQSFRFMAGARSRNPVYQEMIEKNDSLATDEQGSDFRANIGMYAFLVVFFVVPFVTRRRARSLAMKFDSQISNYDLKKDGYLYPRFKFRKLMMPVCAFFGLGFLVILICSIHPVMMAVSLAGLALYSWRHYSQVTKRYASAAAYKDYAAAVAAANAELIRKGFMKKETEGYYDYTDAYYASAEYAGSSDDSSSGGGSSGGGGASSSW